MMTKTNEDFEINTTSYKSTISITYKSGVNILRDGYLDLVIKDDDNEDVVRESFDLNQDGFNKLKDIKSIIDETVKLLEERL